MSAGIFIFPRLQNGIKNVPIISGQKICQKETFMNDWISVKDHYPVGDMEVLAITRFGFQFVGR